MTTKITKMQYQAPETRIVKLAPFSIMTGSTETLPFDPTDGTDDALSKGDDDFWSE